MYHGIGDAQTWRKLMQESIEERSGLLVYLKSAPWNDRMRSDPFFEDFVRQVGLP